MTAASRFLDTLRKHPRPERVSVTLHGSLAFTGKGHATDRAVVLGLIGLLPDTLDPDNAKQLEADVRHSKRLSPDGLGEIRFDPDKDLEFDYGPALPGHANALVLRAYDSTDKLYLEETYYSIGGGFVVNDTELANLSHDKPQDFADEKREQGYPYPFGTAAQMLEMGRKSNLSIAQMKRANEIAHSSEEMLLTRLNQVNTAMNDCIDRGLRKVGELPGGLKVKRRARAIHEQLLSERGTNVLQPHAENDFLSVYAMAVNEENAAGGRVVTSPTNGAAGVIPAVLRYYRDHCKGADSDGEDELLLTASVIGGLIKHNASISGAEVGCQGEVGSASAMAAAGLCAALGGSNEQIENAAEIALEHHLGMTCDPAGGLVQVPCIERNAMGAIKAVSAASLALRGDGTHFMPLDNCIETMRQTGIDMNHKYKETSLGGIAVNFPACCLAVGLIGAAFLATASPAKAESAICKDITRSITLSQSGFESLHDGAKTSGNSFIVTEPLFAASECEMLPNALAHSLRCSWSFAYDDALADKQYDYLLSVVPECLGSEVAVSEDQPVNHPDTYQSHIYQLATAELRVTLKNKYAMKKKFVSMIVESRSP